MTEPLKQAADKLNSANNILLGNGGSDHIFGGGGNDSILGGSGDDIISGGDGNDSMFGDDGVKGSEISSDTERKIDGEIERIMRESLQNAEKNLTQYKNALVAVAEKLLEVETLEQEDYHTLISQFGLNPKTS